MKRAIKPLTPGEMMIWSAAYVAARESTRKMFVQAGKPFRAAESMWAETAQGVVVELREALSDVMDGFGGPGEADYSSTTEMLMDVLGLDEVPDE